MGEVRCNKEEGPKFLEWLTTEAQASPTVTKNIKVYADTKIRLHFSHFKILDEKRDTCFMDSPHQCAEFADMPLPLSKDEL